MWRDSGRKQRCPPTKPGGRDPDTFRDGVTVTIEDGIVTTVLDMILIPTISAL
jgi:hypothetical protein